ncbi:MAG: response regulator [Bacilli bacterium]
MTLRLKLRLFLLWLVVLMGVLVSGVALIANDLSRSLDSIYEYNYNTTASINSIQNIREDISRQVSSVRQLSNAGTVINKAAEQNIVIKARTNAQNNIAKLERLSIGGPVFRQIKENDTNLKSLESDLLILFAENKPKQALKILATQGSVIHSDYTNEILQLASVNRDFLKTSIQNVSGKFQRDYLWVIGIVIFVIALGIGTLYWVVRNIVGRLNRISVFMRNFMAKPSNLPTRLEIQSGDEIGDVVGAFNSMAGALEVKSIEELNIRQSMQGMLWVKTNLVELMTEVTGLTEHSQVGNLLLSRLAPLVEASHGGFFVATTDDHDKKCLNLVSTYAHMERKNISSHLLFGEGLVGQCALERKPIVLTNVPSDYIRVSSGLGETSPSRILVSPVVYGGEVHAVMELAFLHQMSNQQQLLVDEVVGALGILLANITGQMKLAGLLVESQQMTEELQSQSEELLSQQDKLKSMNVELEEHTEFQRQIAEQLRTQQSELEQTNLDLMEKNTLLATKNEEIEKIRVDLVRQTGVLERTSQYKSEFLANVSHELRTPLNSLLILAKLLSENKDGNLSEKQVEFAQAIFSSGNDLLSLINNILDLSKVESGREEVIRSNVRIEDIKELIERRFKGIALDRKLNFTLTVDKNVPEVIYTDEQKVVQVITNLLSNAFKFTPSGDIKFGIMELEGDTLPEELRVAKVSRATAFEVQDTGIGIPKHKQELIFDAFQQADGTISRNYGGTGLGLAISRELARILGGIIRVDSEQEKGSTFTFYLPRVEDMMYTQDDSTQIIMDTIPNNYIMVNSHDAESRRDGGLTTGRAINDDVLGGKRILIVDDDVRNVFAVSSILESKNIEVEIAENGLECIRMLGERDDIDLVLMDIMMSGMDGFTAIRHIRSIEKFTDLPIIVVTGKAAEDGRQTAIECGASDYITKPINLTQFLSLLRVWLYESGRGGAQ